MTDLSLELRRLDRLLHAEAARVRARYAPGWDEIRGLYVSDRQIESLLARAAAVPGTLDGPTMEAQSLDARLEREGSPLRALARRFGLAPFERDVLLLALAVELDLKYEQVIGYLNNDVMRRWPTLDLALRVLGGTVADRAAFDRDGALVGRGLIELNGTERRVPALADGFAPSPVIVRHVLGQSLEDRDTGRFTRVGSHDAADPALVLGKRTRDEVERLARLCASEALAPVVVAQAEQGAGGAHAARLLAGLLGRRLLEVDASALAHLEIDLDVALRRLALRAELGGLGVLVEGWSTLPSPAAARAIAALSPACPLVLDVGAEADWRPSLRGVPHVVLALEAPDCAERARLWQTRLCEHGVAAADGAAREVADRYGLTAAQIADAACSAALALKRAAATDRPCTAGELLTAAKAQLDRRLGDLAAKVDLVHRWEELVLPPSTHGRVRELLAAIRQRGRVYGEWGLGRRGGRIPGLTALFSGASGTGKTMTASIIAAEAGLDLYRIDLAGIVSKYIGETERNLDRIFEAARRAEAVLFFDEADALFGKRSEVKDAHDRYANIEVAYLLQKLELHPGIVVLATNLARNIDAAFARRLQHVVEFPRPDVAARLRLWRGVFTAETPLAPDVDLEFLAEQFEATGGDIRTIAIDAAFLAADADRPIAMADLVRAMARQMRKDGRLPSVSSFRQYFALIGGAQ
jgi:hypothetical protein